MHPRALYINTCPKSKRFPIIKRRGGGSNGGTMRGKPENLMARARRCLWRLALSALCDIVRHYRSIAMNTGSWRFSAKPGSMIELFTFSLQSLPLGLSITLPYYWILHGAPHHSGGFWREIYILYIYHRVYVYILLRS